MTSIENRTKLWKRDPKDWQPLHNYIEQMTYSQLAKYQTTRKLAA